MAKSPKNESSSNIEQDIARAAEKITRLISAELSSSAEATEDTSKKEAPQKKNARFLQSKENQEKKKLAVFSIICLCVIVFAMWGWNTSALWYKTSNTATDNASLWSQAKDDLAKTFAAQDITAKQDTSLQGALNNEEEKQAALESATAAALLDLQKALTTSTSSTVTLTTTTSSTVNLTTTTTSTPATTTVLFKTTKKL